MHMNLAVDEIPESRVKLMQIMVMKIENTLKLNALSKFKQKQSHNFSKKILYVKE